MKKLISVLLALVIAFTISIPMLAEAYISEKNLRLKRPLIVLAGDSNKITYNNGQNFFDINDMFNIYKNSPDGSFKEAALNILYPFILKGIATDDWNDYYDAVYKEISDVYEPIMLDENGNVKNDSGIQAWQKESNRNAMTTSRELPGGGFAETSYEFFYDWRLDPNEIADRLHEYIEGVKSATGYNKVEIISRCLGSNVVLAYINKYGSDSLHGVGLDVSTTNGANFLGGMLSGDFGVDGSGVSRLITDVIYNDLDYASYIELADFATATVNLLENTGVLDRLSKTARDLIYARIEGGIISALALSTFMTYPGYWAIVSDEEFESALNYVFGKEGSEKRIKYKGLIDKITTYNNEVKRNSYSIFGALPANNVNVGIVSKYGVQMVPVVKDSSILGDEYVSVEYSSFGATTGTVYENLSDEYIAQREALGLGKYISPDKKIDASTCLFPNYTWFVKGAQHAMYTAEEVEILMRVVDADHQLTIDDFPWTQFMVYSINTRLTQVMTTENCNTERWQADPDIDKPTTKQDKLTSFLLSLLRWFTSLFRLLAKK